MEITKDIIEFALKLPAIALAVFVIHWMFKYSFQSMREISEKLSKNTEAIVQLTELIRRWVKPNGSN